MLKDFDLFFRRVFRKLLNLDRPKQDPFYPQFKYIFDYYYRSPREGEFLEDLFLSENLKYVRLSEDGSKIIFKFNKKAGETFIFKLLDFNNYINGPNYVNGLNYRNGVFCYADRISQVVLLYNEMCKREAFKYEQEKKLKKPKKNEIENKKEYDVKQLEDDKQNERVEKDVIVLKGLKKEEKKEEVKENEKI